MGVRIQNVHSKEYNGVKYRSTLEAQTAETLDKLGISFEYETKRIELIPSFHCPYQKDMVRHITYTPDFIIGPLILECKGFETPEWKLKKKFIFKYFMENEPETIFYQIHDNRKQLLEALDNHWPTLGYAVEVTSKPTKKVPSQTRLFDSVREAMYSLNIQNKPVGSILRSLTGSSQYVYNYNWKLKKIEL